MDEKSVSPDLAREVLAKRELARRHLGVWCQLASEEEGERPGTHHQLLNRKLEAVERGEITRLMVIMPPGSAKTRYGSILFPPWFMARKKNRKVILASYAAALAEVNNGKMNAVVEDKGHWLGLKAESSAVSHWRTDNGGEIKAAGVDGPITGFRADCLVAGTFVLTPSGIKTIESIAQSREIEYVISYDSAVRTCVSRRVLACRKAQVSEIFRIRTAAGSVVEATGNHRFYTAAGWKPASMLAPGDVLLRRVQGDGVEVGCGVQQEHRSRLQQPVLRKAMRYSVFKPASWLQPAPVQGLWWECCPSASGMLGGVQKYFGGGARIIQTVAADVSKAVRVLRSIFCAKDTFGAGPILLAGMQRFWARSGHSWGEKSRLPARESEWLRQVSRLVCSQTGSVGSGRQGVRSLQGRGPNSGPPYQHDADGPQARKSSLPVQELPQDAACQSKIEVASDYVAVVERVHRECDVYDIQVDGTKCFFANGVLVHNCMIIDDPVKNETDVDSEKKRDDVWKWYWSAVNTRLKAGKKAIVGRPAISGGAVIVIMTRWHQDDLAGRLLASDPGRWDVLHLRAEAVEGKPDPLGREPGQMLWDDDAEYDYGQILRDAKHDLEKSGSLKVWNALYQGEPTPGEGALFDTKKLSIIEAAPAGGRMVRAWDLAATEKVGARNPDWSVGALVQRFEDRVYIRDVVRFRGRPDEVERRIKETARNDGHHVMVTLPKEPAQAGVWQLQHLTAALAGFNVKAIPPTGGKSTRAAPLASQVNVGNVYLVSDAHKDEKWNAAFIDEMSTFPAGTFDDQIDAASDGFSALANVGAISVQKLGY